MLEEVRLFLVTRLHERSNDCSSVPRSPCSNHVSVTPMAKMPETPQNPETKTSKQLGVMEHLFSRTPARPDNQPPREKSNPEASAPCPGSCAQAPRSFQYQGHAQQEGKQSSSPHQPPAGDQALAVLRVSCKPSREKDPAVGQCTGLGQQGLQAKSCSPSSAYDLGQVP